MAEIFSKEPREGAAQLIPFGACEEGLILAAKHLRSDNPIERQLGEAYYRHASTGVRMAIDHYVAIVRLYPGRL